MPRLTEITVRVRRGLIGLAESTAAEVAATYKIQQGDGELASVVEEKFHEVCRALNQALESEPPGSTPQPAGGSGRDDVLVKAEEMEGNTGEEPCPRTESPAEDSPSLDSSLRKDSGDPVGDERIPMRDADGAEETGPVAPTAQPAPTAPHVPDEPAEEERPALVEEPATTAAQQRTIESLRQAANLDDGQLQVILETNFNRKTVRDLTKREGASLILLLSRKQRERIVPDKPETVNPRLYTERKESALSRNGRPS